MADPKYRVVRRLEAGGMAEVYQAEAASLQGFRKQVAIKRVLPHLAQNEKFMAMFLDEARLSARLQHANIVSVFDIGAADNTYFIVMEYVDGANLKKLIENVRKQRGAFPLKEAVYICVEACRGLSYAHELADDDGKLLGIVHRDISPPNIMITKRGEVKVTDFGLAKASTQLEKTDPGVVKGKFSYLAPEAAHGRQVDARADVFSLGIVLWEMLAGRRLFLGENDYQTVKLIQQANVPRLGGLNPEVDADLEQVMAQALAKNPDERFASARAFGDALAGYLFSHQLKVTSYDIANLVNGVVGEDSMVRRQPNDQSIIDKLIQEELVRFTSIDEGGAPAAGARQSNRPHTGSHPLDAGMFENPTEWFSDDELSQSNPPKGASASGPPRTGWRESGIELEPEDLEVEDVESLPSDAPLDVDMPAPPRVPTPDPLEAPSLEAPALDDAVAPAPGYAAAAQPTKGGGLKVALLTALVLIAGAAVAWFGNLIPH